MLFLMKQRKRGSCNLTQALVSFILVVYGIGSQAQERVIWHTADFAPYFIQDGPYKGQGIADRRLQLVIAGLPQFDHQVISGVTPARSNSEVVQKDNLCFVARIRTKAREQIMAFTEQPIIHTLSNGLITTRNRAASLTPYLNKEGALSLREFLLRSPYRLGLTPGRSFGPGIDEVLNQVRPIRPQGMVEVEADNHFRSRLLKLLYQDGYQAILGYPEELDYFTELLSLRGEELVYLPITEEPPLVAGHVACSKSDLGRRVVQAVDQLISQASFRQKVQDAYRHWLDPASLARYNRLLNRQSAQ
ncbi:TIGR02285 family protein [Parvibium lacunae]|nr:TIGR02285 family protein [Parvibium lacunae]